VPDWKFISDSDPPPSSRPSPGGSLVLFIQVASLFVTGWVVWLSSIAPRLHRFTWGSLIGRALLYALLAWAWSAAITAGLYFTMPREERTSAVSVVLRTSSAAVWFAPAIILLSQSSPSAFAAALILVVTATRVLYSQWRQTHLVDAADAEFPPAIRMFGGEELPSPVFWRTLAPSWSIALCLEFAVAAALMQVPLLAAALFATGAAMLTVYAISTGAAAAAGERPSGLPRSILGVILTILLAAGLTVGGLSGRVGRLQRLAGDAAKDSDQSGMPSGPDSALPPPKDAAGFGDGSFPGVILEPEEKPVTMLVAPVLASRGLSAGISQPFSIIFDGQYWMYRWPFREPPRNSISRRGSPAALSFSTTDRWPLNMEARQHLDEPIDMRCCSKVQVEIWNADRFPGTVWLEVAAVEADTPGGKPRSLGSAPVVSSPDLSRDPIVAVSETLDFPVPPDLGACREFQVQFHRARVRLDKSARVSIERFVFVPVRR